MARPITDPVQRFLAKVAPTSAGCHEWQSTIHRDGYGKFFFDGSQASAHRVAYRLFVGDPGELHVLHRCDNRKCVNPEHLFLGTARDNVADMDKKGRRSSRRRLTSSQIAEIRAMRGKCSQKLLADRFRVHQTTISRVHLMKGN